MFPSLRLLAMAVVLSVYQPVFPAPLQADTPSSSSLASISIDVLTFGRPKADFPATIQLHSSSLESDLSSTADKPSKLQFPNLPAGTYRLTATAPSRNPVQLELTLAPGNLAKISLILDKVFPLTLQLDASAAAPSAFAIPSAQDSSLSPSSPRAPSSPSPSTSAPAAASASDPAAPPSADPSFSFSSSADIPSAPAAPDATAAQPFVGSCSAGEVIPRVSDHVQQFVESINRITATELMNFERRNRKGRFEEDAKSKVNYVAIIQPIENGFLSVEEFRNGFPGMSGFPGHISATGSVALVLIFHPLHLNEFVFVCKGLTYWRNLPVYEITFQQRDDVPNTMSEFRVGRMSYDIFLKGTAFVDPDSFQILHLDTDLLRPIPDILELEHQSIDYGAVSFATRSDQLWLPQVATIAVRFRNKDFSERHAYSDYRLFAIDTGQKISKPAVPADPNAPSPN